MRAGRFVTGVEIEPGEVVFVTGISGLTEAYVNGGVYWPTGDGRGSGLYTWAFTVDDTGSVAWAVVGFSMAEEVNA